ncbi:hypothetical protein MTO96_011193 [Rhipicephalus appendiculatus]
MHDMKGALPDFEQSIAPRLLFSVTCEASSYFLNSSRAFHEGDPAVKMTTGSSYWQMCEMAAKLGYLRHYSRHGDCNVVHKDRFWQAGLGPNSTRLFTATRRFAGAMLFAMHADDARGRCGPPHGLANHVRRSLDRPRFDCQRAERTDDHWLQSKQLDGFLFFYRSHPTVTVSDAEFLGYLRHLSVDLGMVGLFVSVGVSFHKEQHDDPPTIKKYTPVTATSR